MSRNPPPRAVITSFDLESWVDSLAGEDEKAAGVARRRLVARGNLAVALLIEAVRHPQNVGQYRAALRALGEVSATGQLEQPEPLRPLLLEHLNSHDGAERRSVINCLGHLGVHPQAEAALLALWAGERRDDQLRVLAGALGRVGGSASERALATCASVAPLVLREVAKARAAIGWRQARSDLGEGRVLGERVLEGAAIRLRCRGGLGGLLLSKLPRTVARAHETAPGQIDAELRGSLNSLLDCRLWSEAVLVATLPAGLAPDPAFAAAMAGEAGALLREVTEGALTWRLHLPHASRGQLLDFVRAAQNAAPKLLNSPRRAAWELRLLPKEIEMLPRFWRDTRFAYLRRSVPAMTHAPLAAALALLSEPRAGDVVWDPFCGGGTELAERAKAGPYAKLIGSDRDPNVLKAAQQNLQGIERLSLQCGDALSFSFKEVGVLLTNPPYGRKVQGGNTGKLLRRLLENASRNMKRGRIVLCSPRPQETWAWAQELGWSRVARLAVGSEGCDIQAQVFTRP